VRQAPWLFQSVVQSQLHLQVLLLLVPEKHLQSLQLQQLLSPPFRSHPSIFAILLDVVNKTSVFIQ
jgi:hypothetical protein